MKQCLDVRSPHKTFLTSTNAQNSLRNVFKSKTFFEWCKQDILHRHRFATWQNGKAFFLTSKSEIFDKQWLIVWLRAWFIYRRRLLWLAAPDGLAGIPLLWFHRCSLNLFFRGGKRLELIRKIIEIEYKRQCNLASTQPAYSEDQFLYPVVPSLIFEKQRKQVLQRDCFMEEKLYSSNLEASQYLNKYVLGQVKFHFYW